MTNVFMPIANAIADCAATIAGVTSYVGDPGVAGVDGNPAVVISVLPVTDRGELDSDEQLGSRTWLMEYDVTILVDLDEPVSAQQLLAETCESFIQAVDADDQLGATSGMVIAARVVSAEPAVIAGVSRPRLAYDCVVRVKAYV